MATDKDFSSEICVETRLLSGIGTGEQGAVLEHRIHEFDQFPRYRHRRLACAHLLVFQLEGAVQLGY